MKRTYLALTGLALAGFSLAGAFPLLSKAGAVFGAQPVDPSRYAVLARPLGTSDWNLVVLEQPDAMPDCWETRSDGLIDPSINRVDVKGICGRYSDSNGYSPADRRGGSRHQLPPAGTADGQPVAVAGHLR